YQEKSQRTRGRDGNNNADQFILFANATAAVDRPSVDQQESQNHGDPQQQQLSPLSNSSVLFSNNLGPQIKRQREELDQFLQAQGQELRCSLAEKRKRHYRALLGAAEESMARRLREKEEEVENVNRRNAELEAHAAQVSLEAQVWMAKARAQEASAASLQAQLQQAIMSVGAAAEYDSRIRDAGMNSASGVEGTAEDAESAYVDPDRVVASGPPCKGCGIRVASVVLLPCRHLCLCTECDRVAQACPLCLTFRNSR
ncbi:E3 ubiquitin-protein ligase BOI-like, partial [Hibiscus syriacus]|uniref:E3 ubiquitin-protein ligase BOI-like n=1 Tax=Hibiscus syriacus TaxID=106335 RepID=UPI001923FD97